MLLRISCTRCRLGSLWTDEPAAFLATVCRQPRRCRATLHDESFRPGLDVESEHASEPGSLEPAA